MTCAIWLTYSELLINAVKDEQAKVADKPEPKMVLQSDVLLQRWEHMDAKAVGGEVEPNLHS